MAEEDKGTILADPPPEPTQSWFPEEHTELVTQKGWKGAGDALKSYGELEGMMSGRAKIPTEESSAEEISAFYDKIRGVENPEGYDMPRPEMPEGMTYDENFEKVIRGIAYDAGISKAQLKTLTEAYNKYQIEQFGIVTAELTKTYDEGKQALQSEWKEQYDANIEVAKRACRELGGDEFVALLNENKLGNNPVFIKTFHNIGLKILNDTLIKGTQGGGDKKDAYKPAYPNSPEQYANDTSSEGEKARLWFTQRGHVY